MLKYLLVQNTSKNRCMYYETLFFQQNFRENLDNIYFLQYNTP